MRVRLTDGTRTVDIRTHPGEQTRLDHIEATALRLLTALDREPADDDARHPIGFSGDLDRIALDSLVERSDQDDPDPYDDPEDDQA